MDLLIKVLAALLLAIAVGVASWLFRDTYQTWAAWLKVHAGKKGIKFLGNWGPLIGITLVLSTIGVYRSVEKQTYHDGLEQARKQARSSFTSMPLPQAVAHCLALPNEVRYQAPLAFAWQPQALDWYVLEGADNASMRHYSCDGVSVKTGKRYERVMLKRVALDGTKLSAGMEQNLFDQYAGFSDADVRALEVTEDPQTRRVVERRWLASGDAKLSVPQFSDALANELPVLLVDVPNGWATAPYPQRTRRVPGDWAEQPEAVFALLEKHVQPGQRIGQLYFAEDQIQVTVVGPVEVVAQPPALFGMLNFDAYGVADQDTWAPALPRSNTCQQGRSLSELKALFAQAPRPHVVMRDAWFDCDPTQAHGNVGAWYLRGPPQKGYTPRSTFGR